LTPILIIAGPTASGKSKLAVELARKLDGEIISADSRQIYRGLDAGTAKPSKEERARVRHHLIDIIDPVEKYNAGRFARDAAGVIEKLVNERKTPIVCGGTGFYIQALVRPFFSEPESLDRRKKEVRLRLKEMYEKKGAEALHGELAGLDPESAARLHPNDFQRVSRALELYHLSGRTMTQLLSEPQTESPYVPFTILLDPQADQLKEAIHLRSKKFFNSGWPEEVRALLASGVSPDAPGLQGLGYKEVIDLVKGKIGRKETLERIIRKTWQYARRQRSWFKVRRAEMNVDPKNLAPEEIISLWSAHCSR
jgi:tRNA dimethylallyltransferase